MADAALESLNQQDLSHLRLQEMSAVERAELRRRYTVFVQHFGAPDPPPDRPVRKWVPGESTAGPATD